MTVTRLNELSKDELSAKAQLLEDEIGALNEEARSLDAQLQDIYSAIDKAAGNGEPSKPIIIDPVAWLLETISNVASNGNSWNDGCTSPNDPGWHERYFTDGLIRQWWSGKAWLVDQDGNEHWRQVGSYPAWRELASIPA